MRRSPRFHRSVFIGSLERWLNIKKWNLELFLLSEAGGRIPHKPGPAIDRQAEARIRLALTET